MTLNNKILVIVAGLVSGYLSVNFPRNFDTHLAAFFYFPLLEWLFVFPGLLFAIAGCLCFNLIYKQIHWPKYLAWTAVSILAYNAAYWATFWLVLALGGSGGGERYMYVEPGAYAAFFVGGFVGAFLVMLGLRWFIFKLSFRQIVSLSLWGGALGLSGLLPGQGESFLYLFLIWQAGMLFLIMQTAEPYFIAEAPI